MDRITFTFAAIGLAGIGALAGWNLPLGSIAPSIRTGIASTLRDQPVATRVPNGTRFSLCHSGGGTNCIVDGDTAWIDGAKIRIADIDAPETHPSRCAREAELGARATARLAQLMNEGPFEVQAIDRDEDRFGRKLRILVRDGRSLGDVLVEEGIARSYGGSRLPWCP